MIHFSFPFENQHIRMISEESCDTEDWSNDAKKISYAITGIHFGFKCIKTVILNCNNISQYCCFYCIFDPINAALVRISDLIDTNF